MTSPLRNIASDLVFGEGVKIYDSVSLYGCEIGDDTKVGTFVEIQGGVKLVNRCEIQSHTFICKDVTIEDKVVIAHGVMFINDLDPAATNEDGEIKGQVGWACVETRICRKASIGSKATIFGGIALGEGASIGAGEVVTCDVPENTLVAGNPVRAIRKRT